MKNKKSIKTVKTANGGLFNVGSGPLHNTEITELDFTNYRKTVVALPNGPAKTAAAILGAKFYGGYKGAEWLAGVLGKTNPISA